MDEREKLLKLIDEFNEEEREALEKEKEKALQKMLDLIDRIMNESYLERKKGK